MKMRGACENRFGKIEFDLAVVKWMVGINLAATMAVLLLIVRY
jgi:hypothetical protein